MRRLLLCVMLSACVAEPPKPSEPVYRTIPQALLQPCVLPVVPNETADLSDAFVQAYRCAALGNRDKAIIGELTAAGQP